jgi:very-short-patch-repair endonuclease
MPRQRVNQLWLAAARLAARQHGVVTRRQLMQLGASAALIDDRLRARRLIALHRGVYLLSPNLLPYSRQMAAVLACSPDAYLSHPSAGHLWSVLPYAPNPASQHVTVVGRNPGRRRGIRIHRVGLLEPLEVTVKHGIPTTTPVRTLLDLASYLKDGDLEQAVAEAFARRLTTRDKLLSTLDGHRGAPRIRELLKGTPARSRSRTERRLLRLLRRARVPEPEVNARVGHWEVDLLWRDHGLAVEVDGYASHSSPRAFSRDYRKTAELEQAGLRVIRISADQVWDGAERTVARIRAALVRPSI